LGDCFGQTFFKGEEEAISQINARRLPDAPWHFTDDTVMTAGIVEVLRDCGTIDQDHLASVFSRRYLEDPRRGYGATAQRMLRQISGGENWRTVARSAFDGMGSHGNGGAMRAAPIGAYFVSDLNECARQARLSAEVTHAHIDGQAGAIAVAVAAAIASERGPSAGREIISSTLPFLPECATLHGMKAALALDESASAVHAATVLGIGLQLSSQDTVPFALWCAARSLDSFEEALWLTVSGLGDRDTTCAIAGGIVALAVGETALPQEWMGRCEAPPF
jgi:ADP-ribosylglycohydrolase